MLAFLQNFGVGEWLIVIAVVLLLFGSTKIPAVARALGRAQSEFKRAKRDAETEDRDEVVLRKARELGIPTEGRAVDDVRKDVEAREARGT